MHLVIILLAALGFFLYLTLVNAKKPDRRYYFYLFVLVDIWLASVFLYLIVTAVMH